MAGYFSTRRRSEKTRIAYNTDLLQLERYLGADHPLEATDADHLERWALEMRNDKYALTSVRRKFATARVFFSYWARKGILKVSPLWGIRLDLGREHLLPRCLSFADAKSLITQAWRTVNLTGPTPRSTQDRRFLAVRTVAIVEILFATGMRVGELVKLAIQDWHEEDSVFIVQGKGSRQRLAVMPDERSRKAIELYLRYRAGVALDHDWLLVNGSGRRISTHGAARIVTRLAEAAGISTRVTPHMIRHTLATLLLRNGADIRIVQEVLGHASIATTQRYTHVTKDHLISALCGRHPSNQMGIEMQS